VALVQILHRVNIRVIKVDNIKTGRVEMRFDASEGSEQFYEQISNFFHAFGFFILGNALPREDQERLLKVGDKISLDRKKVLLEHLPADTTSFFGHTIEDYAELKELLVPN